MRAYLLFYSHHVFMPYCILDTQVSLFELHSLDPENFPYLLESVAENDKIGRYDMLFYRPQQSMALEALDGNDFLRDFDQQWRKYQSDEDTSIPGYLPFRGGWFVFFSYELAQQIEPKLSLTTPPYPIAYAAKCGAAIIVDKFRQRTYFVSDLSEPQALDGMRSAVEALSSAAGAATRARVSPEVYEDDEAPFLSGVCQSRQYIVDGDVFQVNLSRGWSCDVPSERVADLYAQLRESNPAPFAASCHIRVAGTEYSILSSSPERLISLRDGRIETRPIAGTRPRGTTTSDDKALSLELIEHVKERAEHIMLIDLERNDLGRICQPGSVHVDELMVIESYAHVHHIVSNVVGQLRPGISPADAIRAVFPGGTITGCPKLRCMQIIHELEDTFRGAYTGSLGYVNHNGDMDSNILIRTIACYNGKAEFRAGAGIVYDSHPEHELKETRNKAKGMLKAL